MPYFCIFLDHEDKRTDFLDKIFLIIDILTSK